MGREADEHSEEPKLSWAAPEVTEFDLAIHTRAGGLVIADADANDPS